MGWPILSLDKLILTIILEICILYFETLSNSPTNIVLDWYKIIYITIQTFLTNICLQQLYCTNAYLPRIW